MIGRRVFLRQQEALDVAGQFDIGIELVFIDLQLHRIAIVHGQTHLLGERFDQRKIGLGKGEPIRRIGHREYRNEFALEEHRGNNERANLERGVLVLHDSWVVCGVGD